ncbi:MAG: LysE family translocator [Deltaproteobacteria bacterium]|nr:LysE family translocator [Deltaproteobacteria bacterium]
MFDIVNYPLFLLTAVTLNLYPGPDTLYILGRSAAQGRAAGIVSALGIGMGAVIHTLLGAAGLTALVAASATAYQLVKWAGAAYLIYLGLTMIFSKSAGVTRTEPAQSLPRIFRQGVLTNVLNPKVALFFLALIPQFIAQGAAHPGLAFLVLGLTFVTTGTTWCLIVAALGGMLNRRLTGGNGAVWLKRAGGGILAGLGAKLALSD